MTRATGGRLAGLAAAALAASLAGCAPSRPAGAARAPSRDVDVERIGDVHRLGASWVAPAVPPGSADGILVGRFAGAPYDLGLAFGRLTRPWIRAQETHLDALFDALVPLRIKRAVIRQVSAFRLRSLPDAIPPDLLVAIAGVADGYEPVPPASGWNAWRRILNRHALHDVSQRFVDAPALAAACTGFAARTGDGGVLIARNFDFEGGEIFDRKKLVSVVVPEGKIPYLSVGWSGMIGVVSGFNREGIGVALQAVAGGETRRSGEPVTLLLADVLQNESTFDGAVGRLRSARVFVSDLIFLADAKTRRVAVVEKSPSAFGVREAEGAWIAATNEAEDAGVRARSHVLPPESTSRKRRARLDVLLAEKGAALDVAGAVAILRDRRGAGGADLGPGNRNAIDASIAAHSVVLDLGRRRAWVAAAPHTLGPYVPVDLEAVLGAAGGPPAGGIEPVPADPWLVSGGFDRYRRARAALGEVRRFEKAGGGGWLEAAASSAERAHALSPDFAEATAKLAELELRRGNRARSLALFDEALARDPGPAPVRAAAERWREAAARGGALPKHPVPTIPTPDELVAESGK